MGTVGETVEVKTKIHGMYVKVHYRINFNFIE